MSINSLSKAVGEIQYEFWKRVLILLLDRRGVKKAAFEPGASGSYL
jgi:hypothetical protein